MTAATDSIPTHVGDMTNARIRLSMQLGAFDRGSSGGLTVREKGVRLTARNIDTDTILATETVWCSSRWDAAATNTLGQPGAYVAVMPDDAAVATAALRLIEEHEVTEMRDRRLAACGVPLLPY